MNLRTERLLLRRARTGDLASMHAIMSDPRAMRYWSTPPHTEIEQTRAWLAGMIAAPPETSDDYVVELDGTLIGKAGCWRVPEIGFIFHPDHWGRGYAREALTAILARVFDTFLLDEIEADVDPRNEASLGLLKRLGFRQVRRAERTWLVGEEWCDSVYLALGRDQAVVEPARTPPAGYTF